MKEEALDVLRFLASLPDRVANEPLTFPIAKRLSQKSVRAALFDGFPALERKDLKEIVDDLADRRYIRTEFSRLPIRIGTGQKDDDVVDLVTSLGREQLSSEPPVDTAADIEVLEAVNSGCFGRVYRGRQTKLKREIAIKIIKPDQANRADAIKHAQALARVAAHPNIVTVHDIRNVHIDGLGTVPAIIMEWLEGSTLEELLAGDRVSLPDVIRICEGVLDGMDHMHKAGVAHRDLHEGNILLTDGGPKIIDIDATRENSLGKMSTSPRQNVLNADVDLCRRILFQVVRRSTIDLDRVVDFNSAIQAARSLEDMRTILRGLDSDSPSSVPFEWTAIEGKIGISSKDNGPGVLVGWRSGQPQIGWLSTRIYLEKKIIGQNDVIIPIHKCSGKVSFENGDWVPLTNFKLESDDDQETVASSSSQIVLKRAAGMIKIIARFERGPQDRMPKLASAELTLCPIDASNEVSVECNYELKDDRHLVLNVAPEG